MLPRRDVALPESGLPVLKIMFVLLALPLVALAQASSDQSFSVHHSKKASFSLSTAQMREAEHLYKNACMVVQRDFQTAELRPHFRVIIGADRNEVHTESEIWMKKWDPAVFARGVVLIALLKTKAIDRLTERAVHYSNATVDVSAFK